MQTRRHAVRRLTILGVGAFLMLGAGAPTACQRVRLPHRCPRGAATTVRHDRRPCTSPALGLDTLTGPAPSGMFVRGTMVDPACGPDGGAGPAAAGYPPGVIAWTAQVTARDPNEALTIRPCRSTSEAMGFAVWDRGFFTIETRAGNVHGTINGTEEFGYPEHVSFLLTIVGGTGAYARATGTLDFEGCVTEDGPLTGRLYLHAPPPSAYCDAPA